MTASYHSSVANRSPDDNGPHTMLDELNPEVCVTRSPSDLQPGSLPESLSLVITPT